MVHYCSWDGVRGARVGALRRVVVGPRSTSSGCEEATISGSILVPVDGSRFAEHALPHALGIARRTGGALHLALVHVPAEPVGPSYPLSEVIRAHHQEERVREADYLLELVERLEPSGVALHPVLLDGPVADTLVDYIEGADVGVVAMTTHGRGGFQRHWLGSTADNLMLRCAIPLLLVRPSRGTEDVGPESDRVIRRMVAALDGSGIAETALGDALELGITDGASLTLVHVLQPTASSTAGYPESREQEVRLYLDALAQREALKARSCHSRVALDSRPAPAVIGLAEELDADLIVLGTHGRSGLGRLILGSVADEVIRGTHRPVLVHRGPGDSTPSPRPR